jgi:hypothetical protein
MVRGGFTVMRGEMVRIRGVFTMIRGGGLSG